MEIVMKSVADLIPYARNARTHTEAQIVQIASSIREFGFTNPVLIDEENGIIAGHGRVLAAQKLGMADVPCIPLSHLTKAQKRAYMIADNKLALNAGWDEELLKLELDELRDLNFDLDITGFAPEEIEGLDGAYGDGGGGSGGEERLSLAERFLVPPFTVLNARGGGWQDRKKEWISLGIKSEEGRDDLLVYSMSAQPGEVLDAKAQYEKKIGKIIPWAEFFEKFPNLKVLSGTSVFDPVLCEIVYSWFSPRGGVVIDPFAGGSVRGIVAAKLGRQYIGCDLMERQVEANRAQWSEIEEKNPSSLLPVIGEEKIYTPTWHCADSMMIRETCAGVEADFIFSCPPYADLELYSDDPRDLSTMDYPDFRKTYFEIISRSCSLLKENRFACFAVGEVRDKRGNYYDFVGDTVQAFRDAGLQYYNEIILVTQVGSLAMRAGKYFETSRKIGKTHQNVLVFLKGDAKKATRACGLCEIQDISVSDDE